MLREFCKSKIHRVTVTEANLNYTGSLTIDEKLMMQADILPYERVQILNVNNGIRCETYVIPGKKNSGVICLNGPAARLGQVGDKIIIISYCFMDDKEIKSLSCYKPKIIFVNDKNKIVKKNTIA